MANELINTNNIIEVKDDIYPEHGRMRDIEIDGAIWLCASDVCEMLGYGNPSDALKKHVQKTDIAKREVRCYGQMRKMTFINSSGVYDLCNKSRLPKSSEIKDWIKSKLFMTVENTSLVAIKNNMLQDDKFIDSLSSSVLNNIGVGKDDIDAYKTLMDSNGLMSIGDFAKTLAIPHFGRTNMFKLLREMGIVYYEKGNNVPKQEYVEGGFMKIIYSSDASGKHVTPKTVLTMKGFKWLRGKMREWGYLR